MFGAFWLDRLNLGIEKLLALQRHVDNPSANAKIL